MCWRQFYDDGIIPWWRANAHLYNSKVNPPHTTARLLSYPWDWCTSVSELEICFFPSAIIGALQRDHQPKYYRAYIEPTFPKSIISTDIADELIPDWVQKLHISRLNPDIFGHGIELIGKLKATPEFRGKEEDRENILVSPSISCTLRFHEWYILSEEIAKKKKPFVIIGADILHQIVTIFSNEWIMVGADDEMPPIGKRTIKKPLQNDTR